MKSEAPFQSVGNYGDFKKVVSFSKNMEFVTKYSILKVFLAKWRKLTTWYSPTHNLQTAQFS